MKHSPAQFQDYPPCSALKPFVQRYVHSWSRGGDSLAMRIPPTGGIYMIYVYATPVDVHFSDWSFCERPSIYLGGQLRDEQPVVESVGRMGLLGVEFTPSGFYRLYQRNALEFTDSIADFRNIDASGSAWLLESLSPRRSIKDNITALEQYFKRLIPDAVETDLVDSVVKQINTARGVVRIADLAETHNVSVRKLHREFLRVVGIPAKRYAKIVQLDAIFAALMQHNNAQLSDLAQQHGYFDQAHFIRDFQEFVQTNPSDFLQGGHSYLRTFLGAMAR